MNKEMKEEIKHIIRGLYDCSYYNKKIIDINNKLEAISVELIGISSPVIKECIIENKKPYTHKNKFELIMKEDELIKERENYSQKILKYESLIQSLDYEIRKYVIDLYIVQKKHSDIATKHHYSRQALYNKINRALAKVLHCK